MGGRAAGPERSSPTPPLGVAGVEPEPPPPAPVAPSKLADLELDAIRRMVEECGGNISEASKRLGVSRNTVYRKLRQEA